MSVIDVEVNNVRDAQEVTEETVNKAFELAELKDNKYHFPQLVSIKEALSQQFDQDGIVEGMIVNEDNVQEYKKMRARYNSLDKALSDERIKIKKEIMEKYDDFHEQFKDTLGEELKRKDILSKAINEYEDQVREDNFKMAKDYWEEFSVANGIGFVTYEQAELPYGLNVTKSQVAKHCEVVLGTINEKLNMISMMPDSDRILEEFKKDLDLNRAIEKIKEENRIIEEAKRREEEEKARMERLKQAEEQRKALEGLSQPETVSTQPEPVIEPERPVVPKVEVPEQPAVTKVQVINYKVRATNEQHQALLKCMKELGVVIEDAFVDKQTMF